MNRRSTAFAASLALLVALPLAAHADDTLPTSKGDLVIHPYHHAALSLTWNGTTILVDPAPAPGGQAGDPVAEFTAGAKPDIVLVTHEHPDHFNADILKAVVREETTLIAPASTADKMPADLKAKTSVMKNGDSLTVKDIGIEAVPAYNTTADREKFHPKGRDNGYVLTFGETRIYIAGDTEDTPEMRALTDIEAAFLPMNLPYTMSIEQAADAVKAFRPKIVYPYHYGQSDVAAFKAAVGDAADVRLLQWYPK